MFFSKQITAIDIGSSSIKVARMKKKRSKLQLIDTAREKISSEVFTEPELLVTTLDNIFSLMGYRPDYVTTAVSSKNVITRNIEFPAMSQKELSKALELGAEEYLTFPIEDLKFKYKVLNKNEEKMEILLAAIKNDVLNNYTDIFKKAKLNLNVINIQSMALLSLVYSQLEIEEPVIILDIGARGSRIIIGDSNNIYLVRNLETGGDTFTDIIRDLYDLEEKQAEEYKKKMNLIRELEKNLEPTDEATFSTTETFTSFSVLIDYFVNEIERSQEFFDKKFNNFQLKNIFFTGGGSRIPELETVINDRLENKLESINPLENLSPQQKIDRDYSVAVGLVASEVLSNAV
ncbi:MAG: type IV pilus assembly protein PilM [Bacillota bacterium]